MGHQKNNNKGVNQATARPHSMRRGYMPEPDDVTKNTDQVVHQSGNPQEGNDRNKQPCHRDTNKTTSFNFTQTSCIMAIKNYVEKMNSKQRKRRNVSSKDNAEKLICSLKNDIQMISKYEEEAASSNGKQTASDPFFVLSAMMCKINKLENILLSLDCREQMAKRRDMIAMARCIKKTILEQAHCDERILHEKKRKMICLVKSLDMFERDIRCATRGIKRLCCPPTLELESSSNYCGSITCCCLDKEKCAKECPGSTIIKEEKKPASRTPSVKWQLNSNADPCKGLCLEDPCKKYDITGLNVVYTKSRLQKDVGGVEKEEVKNQVSCEMNEEEKCKVTVTKEGKTTCSEDCNPIIKQKMNNLSKIWMESARQLIDACSPC